MDGRRGWVTRDGRRSDRHRLARTSIDWHWRGKGRLAKRLVHTSGAWKESGRLRTFGGQAIVEGAARRIRPKLMTVLIDMIGLLPVLLSVGTGADL